MKKTRLGLVGCGGIAKTHAGQFENLGDKVDVTAVVDVMPERAAAVSEYFPGGKVLSDYHDAYDLVDAVLLSLPHHLHCDISIDFMNAGKHVLVEKPMANSEAECLRMIECMENTNRILMVAYCMRYHPLVNRMKELIAKKEYGDCFQVSIWTEQHTQYDPPHWGLDPEKLGGGQFFSHGCHYVDILLWYLGKPVRGTHMGTNFGTPWMAREGTSNVTLEFENGAMGYHFGTWGAKGSRLGYSFHAHCTEGMLEIDFEKGALILHQGKEEKVLEENKTLKPMRNQMAHFLDCIEKGGRPVTDPYTSLEGLKVIWKLYEAERNNVIADLRV